jgi:hypothetical protein
MNLNGTEKDTEKEKGILEGNQVKVKVEVKVKVKV